MALVREVYNDLLTIRTYLIKIGPSRRQGDILRKKFNEVKFFIDQYNIYLHNISNIPKLTEDENLINNPIAIKLINFI